MNKKIRILRILAYKTDCKIEIRKWLYGFIENSFIDLEIDEEKKEIKIFGLGSETEIIIKYNKFMVKVVSTDYYSGKYKNFITIKNSKEFTNTVDYLLD